MYRRSRIDVFRCACHAALAEWYIEVKGQAQLEGIAIAGAAQIG